MNCRFIPVHTGNTANKMAKRNGSPVHPRAYGEHRMLHPHNYPDDGSSPCIRGTHVSLRYFGHLRRFIPVHTGNTAAAFAINGMISVHPRAYGEHYLPSTKPFSCIGSSPCIRGTHSNCYFIF